MYNLGAKYTYAITRKGHIHRLILPIFLHASFLHLFWNLISLYMFGFTIELAIGKWYKYIALIIVGGIGGNIISATFSGYSISVGASSSLFGILGAFLIWFFKRWSQLSN